MSSPTFQAFVKAIQARTELDGDVAPEAVSHLNSGLIEMLDHISPDRAVLRQVMFSGDVDLIKGLIARHGIAPYREIQLNPNRRVSLSSLISEKRIDILRALYQAGLPVAEDRQMTSSALLSMQDPDLLDFFLFEAEQPDLLFPTHAHDAIRVIEGAAGVRVGKYLETIDAKLRLACLREVMTHLSSLTRMKPMAFALTSGFDLVQYALAPLEFYPAAVRDLMAQSQSAHGRLALKSREPNLVDLMARPSNGTFFGLTDKDLKK